MKTTESRDGTSIAFDNLGEGAPVIIVAGALSARLANREFAELLAQQFTVLNYDRRGRGDSGDTAPYDVAREIEDLDTLIGEAGGSASVVGFSSGGNLALEAAARGSDISRLALWEPNFIVNSSRPPLPDDYVDHLSQLVADGRHGDAVAYFMTTAVGLPEEMVAQMRGAPFWAGAEAVAHTLAYDGAVVGDSMAGVAPKQERWATVKAPTLVLDGGTTPWMSDGADAIAGTLPTGERRTLEGETHDVSARALAPAVAEFFA